LFLASIAAAVLATAAAHARESRTSQFKPLPAKGESILAERVASCYALSGDRELCRATELRGLCGPAGDERDNPRVCGRRI